MSQNVSNHRHLPALFLTAVAAIVAAAVCLGFYAFGSGHHLSRIFACLIVAAACTALIGRRYVTRLQDRIIKMEMRYRTDRFLTPERRTTLWALTRPQIMALRFASDAEMPALIDRAAKEKLSPSDIKKAVTDWQPDFDRT